MEEVESRRGVVSGGMSSLLASHWLVKEGEAYQFRIDLLRLWLRREHPIAQLQFEITGAGLPVEPV